MKQLAKKESEERLSVIKKKCLTLFSERYGEKQIAEIISNEYGLKMEDVLSKVYKWRKEWDKKRPRRNTKDWRTILRENVRICNELRERAEIALEEESAEEILKVYNEINNYCVKRCVYRSKVMRSAMTCYEKKNAADCVWLLKNLLYPKIKEYLYGPGGI